MIQLLVLWLAKRKLAHKYPLEKQEQAALAFLKKHVFATKYTPDGSDCRECESNKTFCCGIMLKIPPWMYIGSGSFSYDFNVAFDVIFCKTLVGAYFNQASVFKGLLTLWSIISTCFGILFWFYKWKSPVYFIHRTPDDVEDGDDRGDQEQSTQDNEGGNKKEYIHYSIDVGGIITPHPDKEDTVNGNFMSTCQNMTLLAFDEVSQIIISILSLTLLEPLSDWPGFVEWLNIASSILGFMWYFYSVLSESRYWGVHVMAGPFRPRVKLPPPISRTLNVIDGLLDMPMNYCEECNKHDEGSENKECDESRTKGAPPTTLSVANGNGDEECQTASDVTLSEEDFCIDEHLA